MPQSADYHGPLSASLRTLVGRRHLSTGLALVGLLTTFGVAIGFDVSEKVGTVAFAPWVGLIGFELGPAAGAAASAAAVGLWIAAESADGTHQGLTALVIRAVALVVIGVGAGMAGRRLRAGEVALRSFVSLQSALIDSTLDGICLTDPDGRILISNTQLRWLSVELGMPQHGTVPERLLAIADGVVQPELYRTRMRELAASAGAETSDEFEQVGTGRCFRGYTAPVIGADGTPTGRVWTLREVTADRELDRMRDAFVATVSHELRTPLTSIAGFLEMMEEEEHGVGATGRTYLDVIRRSTERLHTLVEDLLLVAQIEAHRVELDIEEVDLVELVRRTVEECRPAATERQVSIELVGDHPPFVRGDARRLSQVSDNLVSNAVKFTGAGGSVTVSVAGHGDVVHLVVSDTGVGISADDQGQVFSRFFRARTASRGAIPGTGLGLSITRALVEQHGGTISLESEEGRGTQVTVTLPAGAHS